MKYKCQVCGQIIDNNEMCPFCGSDSSQIVPLDGQVKKGHYRCLVCGRETDNGDFCPYCGSQRLYNLDTQQTEDTKSVPIMDEDVSNEKVETSTEEVKDEPIEVKPVAPTKTLEQRYFETFGELLPLESIANPDPEKVNALYTIGLNRGEKITPLEVADAFYEGKEEEEETKEVKPQEIVKGDVKEVETPRNVELNQEPKEPVIENPMENVPLNEDNDYEFDYYVNLLLSKNNNEITKVILNEIHTKLLGENKEDDLKAIEEKIISFLEIKVKKTNSSEYKKDLELLKVLFKD
jgi:Primosomal protein N'' (replication factor Y) - superfamily II helicase